MAETVKDDAAHHRFTLEAEGGTAFILYRRTPGLVTLLHTEVPPALGGRGIGSALVRGALDLIRAEGARIVVKCDFIAGFIRKHPEYRDLTAPGA